MHPFLSLPYPSPLSIIAINGFWNEVFIVLSVVTCRLYLSISTHLDRIVGLMFLLTLALRVFTLVEFVVREALQSAQQYDGRSLRW